MTVGAGIVRTFDYRITPLPLNPDETDADPPKSVNETDNGQNEETFSIITKTKFNNQVANAILDSGAGPSVMDLGTFESLGISSEIKQLTECKDVLRDASDNQMNILGIAKINVHIMRYR